MSEILSSDTTYRIETPTGAGHITDPVVDDVHHDIDPYDDKRGGVIEVERPDSAKYIVDSSERLRFVSKAPTDKAVKEAERENFSFGGSDACVAFAKRFGNSSLGRQRLEPSEGFDPESDDATNGQKITVEKAYNRLQDAGYDDEAGYLRALGSVSLQTDFIKFARGRLGVEL